MFQVKSSYSIDKTVKNVRYMTLEEAKLLPSGSHVLFTDDYEKLFANAKVTSVKTWKRNPGKCEVHLKYGMYEYFTETFTDNNFTRLIVEVKDAKNKN